MKKLEGLNLQGEFDNRVLCITHHDADGIMCAAAVKMAANLNREDAVIYYDIDPKTSKTDEMVLDAIKGMDALSMNPFKAVYITDRAMCSAEVTEKLVAMGTEKIVHIDHHPSNMGASREQEGMPRFQGKVSVYPAADAGKEGFSASYLCAEYFGIEMNESKAVTFMLTDLYDTFKWTRVGLQTSEELVGIYGEACRDFILTRDLAASAVNYNYVFKFLDSELFFEDVLRCFKNNENILDANSNIARKYARLEDDTLKYINYSYNDCSNNVERGKYFSKLFRVDREDMPKGTEVLVIDKPLDFGVSSVASHRFLKEHPNVVLVFRGTKHSTSFSCRTTGNLSLSGFLAELGGGGHANAGGFTINSIKDEMDALTNKTFECLVSTIEVAANKNCLDNASEQFEALTQFGK